MYVYNALRPKVQAVHIRVRENKCNQVVKVAIQLCNSAVIQHKARVLDSVSLYVYI